MCSIAMPLNCPISVEAFKVVASNHRPPQALTDPHQPLSLSVAISNGSLQGPQVFHLGGHGAVGNKRPSFISLPGPVTGSGPSDRKFLQAVVAAPFLSAGLQIVVEGTKC